eukprot:GEZU01022219.1.p1 GENE.GEZU01022219.1~~GEZU01022219.1.p1  ORF type:complete len:1060 (-),score=190.44 GEZU01022219.1:82-3261(-)
MDATDETDEVGSRIRRIFNPELRNRMRHSKEFNEWDHFDSLEYETPAIHDPPVFVPFEDDDLDDIAQKATGNAGLHNLTKQQSQPQQQYNAAPYSNNYSTPPHHTRPTTNNVALPTTSAQQPRTRSTVTPQRQTRSMNGTVAPSMTSTAPRNPTPPMPLSIPMKKELALVDDTPSPMSCFKELISKKRPAPISPNIPAPPSRTIPPIITLDESAKNEFGNEHQPADSKISRALFEQTPQTEVKPMKLNCKVTEPKGKFSMKIAQTRNKNKKASVFDPEEEGHESTATEDEDKESLTLKPQTDNTQQQQQRTQQEKAQAPKPLTAASDSKTTTPTPFEDEHMEDAVIEEEPVLTAPTNINEKEKKRKTNISPLPAETSAASVVESTTVPKTTRAAAKQAIHEPDTTVNEQPEAAAVKRRRADATKKNEYTTTAVPTKKSVTAPKTTNAKRKPSEADKAQEDVEDVPAPVATPPGPSEAVTTANGSVSTLPQASAPAAPSAATVSMPAPSPSLSATAEEPLAVPTPTPLTSAPSKDKARAEASTSETKRAPEIKKPEDVKEESKSKDGKVPTPTSREQGRARAETTRSSRDRRSRSRDRSRDRSRSRSRDRDRTRSRSRSREDSRDKSSRSSRRDRDRRRERSRSRDRESRDRDRRDRRDSRDRDSRERRDSVSTRDRRDSRERSRDRNEKDSKEDRKDDKKAKDNVNSKKSTDEKKRKADEIVKDASTTSAAATATTIKKPRSAAAAEASTSKATVGNKATTAKQQSGTTMTAPKKPVVKAEVEEEHFDAAATTKLQNDAKDLKHRADKMLKLADKGLDKSEAERKELEVTALDCYISAGTKWLMAAYAYEHMAEQAQDPKLLYQQTAHFFNWLASTCVNRNQRERASLCFLCCAQASMRAFQIRRTKTYQMGKDIANQLKKRSVAANSHATHHASANSSPHPSPSPSQQPLPSSPSSQSPPVSKVDTPPATASSGISSTPPQNQQDQHLRALQIKYIEQVDDVFLAFEALAKSEAFMPEDIAENNPVAITNLHKCSTKAIISFVNDSLAILSKREGENL